MLITTVLQYIRVLYLKLVVLYYDLNYQGQHCKMIKMLSAKEDVFTLLLYIINKFNLVAKILFFQSFVGTSM